MVSPWSHRRTWAYGGRAGLKFYKHQVSCSHAPRDRAFRILNPKRPGGLKNSKSVPASLQKFELGFELGLSWASQQLKFPQNRSLPPCKKLSWDLRWASQHLRLTHNRSLPPCKKSELEFELVISASQASSKSLPPSLQKLGGVRRRLRRLGTCA